jgi:hypothetical protein
MARKSGGKNPNLRLGKGDYEFALRHIEKYGDTDLLPMPFEYAAIRNRWSEAILPWFLKQDVTTWVPRPARRILVPKRPRGLRMAMQLDPLDSIFYTALVVAMAPEIEKARVPVSKRVAISHRFKKNTAGDLWRTTASWDEFGKRSREIATRPGVHFVLKTDIADFYSRIYHHRLEASLFNAVSNAALVRATMALLGAWGGDVSYGIPVGNAASRLLAEAVLNQIDTELINQGFTHCRWIDDFRVFCKDEREAARAETFLARSLFEIHGLTLQSSKSSTVDCGVFLDELEQQDKVVLRVTSSGDVIDDEALAGSDVEGDDFFIDMEDVGNASLAEVDFEDLPKSTREILEEHDIAEVLRILLAQGRLDLGLGRTLIRELARREDPSAVQVCIDNVETLSLILSDVVSYIVGVKNHLTVPQRKKIGKRALNVLRNSPLGENESGAIWLLWLFAESSSFDNEAQLAKLYETSKRDEEKRKVMLAMGNADMASWFMRMRNSAMAMPPWNRRAFLYAARCMNGDERKHWYKSVAEQLDVLEEAIRQYADKVGVRKRQ